MDDQLEGDEEASLVRAALRLAQGDGPGAARLLEQRLEVLIGHQMLLGTGLGLLVKAWLAAGNPVAAELRTLGVSSRTGSRSIGILTPREQGGRTAVE